ncbi:MAG: hypothetical protein HON90_15905, partial [Halobacteriovoraceae bacterium]|nr:hypothetical protein [Halobacteriovoraceae bacterium]
MNKLIKYLFLFVLATSCIFEAPQNTLKDESYNGISAGGEGNGNGLTNGNGSLTGEDGEKIAKVELRHLIEPKVDDASDGGDYKRKLTIPKNYNKDLYLAGINISALNPESVYVRFSFGMTRSTIIIPATVSTAPGLTPQTEVQVLILDLKSKPFEDVQLLYDLYDYNNYDFAGTGNDPGALGEAVNFNRDDKLFCRGLNLEDDSTFAGSLSNGCNASGDTCKYAYVKVVDKGLIKVGSLEVPIVPDEMNTQSLAAGYYSDTDAVKLQRCLPDNPIFNATSYLYDYSNTFATFESSLSIDGNSYLYRGPYRPINIGEWQVTGEALKGETG